MLHRIRGHHLWPAPLNAGSVVVDAGAHHGEFSAGVIAEIGARCFLVEANPVLAAELNLPGAACILSAALAARDGRTAFHTNANLEAGAIAANTARTSEPMRVCLDADRTAGLEAGASESVMIETISLPALMQRWHLDRIDLLKLDIEGAEFDLIESTPDDVWRHVGQITVEFHDFLPRFAGRGLFERAQARLRNLGFVCCVMSFRTHGDVLFLNRERLHLRAFQSLYARHLARFVEKTKALLG